VVNKIDLAEETARSTFAVYEKLGYAVCMSALRRAVALTI